MTPANSTGSTDIIIRLRAMQQDRSGAEILLRAGAILNAIISSSRDFQRTAVSTADKRDQLQAWVHIASYVTELHKLMTRRHDGLGWKLAHEGVRRGLVLPGDLRIEAAQAILNPQHEFFKTCKFLRDKLGFHVDADAFMTWLDSQEPESAMSVLAHTGPHIRDFVASASATAVLLATSRMCGADFPRTVAELVFAMPALIEAMCMGFAVRNDLPGVVHREDGTMHIVLG